jgi:predicted PP-loop superfamily ATPase
MDNDNNNNKFITDTVTRLLEEIQLIKTSLVRIEMTQDQLKKNSENQDDLIVENEDYIEEKFKIIENRLNDNIKQCNECPARISLLGNKSTVAKFSDLAIILGVIILLLKLFKVIPE